MALVYDEEQPQQPKLQYDEPPPSNAPTGTQTGSIVRGIPIVGPLLDKGVAAVAAAPAAVIPGMSYRDTYNKMIGGQDRYERENPVASTIGQTAGSVLATVPVARAFPKVFGGATMSGQTAAGGAIGGTDAAVRSGGDIDAIKTGALIGAAAPVMGSVLAPIGQGIASGARWVADRPGVRSVIAPRIQPPPASEILDAAEAGYQTLGRNVKYDPAAINDLTNRIKRDLYEQSASGEVGAKEAHRILDTMASLPPNPASLHTIRKELQGVTGGTEGHSARFAKDRIEQFLEAPPPNAVTTGQMDAATVAQRLKNANADYRAAKNSEEARDRLTKAQLEAGTAMTPVPFMAEGQALRKNVTNLLKSDKASKFLLPADRTALEAVSRPQSIGEGMLRLASGASGTSRPNFHTLLSGSSAAYLSDPLTAAALMAGGAGATAATSGLSRRAFEHADKVIRSSSPHAQAMMREQLPPRISMSPSISQMPASISAKAHRDEIARLLALQAEREAVERSQ